MERRKLLQAVSASGMSLGFIGSSAANSRGKLDTKEVTAAELDSTERLQVLSQVKQDIDVQDLTKSVAKEGWEPQWKDATVDRVSVSERNKSGVYDTSIVNFKNKDSSEDDEMFLLWVGNNSLDSDELSPIIHHLKNEGDNVDDFVNTTGGRQNKKSISYEKENEVVKETGQLFTNQQQEEPTDSEDVQIQETEYCSIDFCVSEGSVEMSCVARVIINAGVTGASCLGSPLNWLAIIGCLGGMGITADQLNQCDFGCDNQTHEVERDWLEETVEGGIDDPCSYYSSQNTRNYPIPEDYIDDVPTN